VRIDILTLFPGMFSGPFDESILSRAQSCGQLELRLVDIRGFSTDRHRTVDDVPYGGGPGMVLRCEPLFAAIESVRKQDSRVVLLSPQGRVFNQRLAAELAAEGHLVLVCGRYEGVDERVRDQLVDDEISIGDYVVTGGELPAMVLVDAVTRLLPNVLGAEASLEEESHSGGLLEYPQYTRPGDFRGWQVPPVLLSGNHEQIRRWRLERSLDRTFKRRPELVRREHVELALALRRSRRARRRGANTAEPDGLQTDSGC
jgi:tRNA (guanine37-N1)-methyltransferase